jgi:hypothetical protein
VIHEFHYITYIYISQIQHLSQDSWIWNKSQIYIRWQNNNYSTNIYTDIYWSLGSRTVVHNELWQEWHDYKCVSCIGEFVRGPLWGEAAWCCCTGWLSWLMAGLATTVDMAGRDGAMGCVWAPGCSVSRWHWVPGGLDAEIGIASAERWSARPRWAAWPCSQTMFLHSDVLWTDYSFLMCSQTRLLLLVVSHECWL